MSLNHPLRWMLRRDLRAQGFDPLLPRGTRKCWCAECGLYFQSLGGFTGHLTTERTCLAVRELRAQGWTQGPAGHWLMPAEDNDRLAQLRDRTRRAQRSSGDLQKSDP